MLETLGDDLAGYEISKGALRFAVDAPLPKRLHPPPLRRSQDVDARVIRDDLEAGYRVTMWRRNVTSPPTANAGSQPSPASMILHDWGEAANREILRKCYEALPDGGVVLISELLVDDDKTGPLPAAMVSLNMLVETAGRNYTAAEHGTWLRETGFTDIHVVPFEAATANAVVVATRPFTPEPRWFR